MYQHTEMTQKLNIIRSAAITRSLANMQRKTILFQIRTQGQPVQKVTDEY